MTTIYEEKKYYRNVNIVIKNSQLDVPAKQVLSSDYNSLNVNIVIKNLLLDVPAKQVLSSDYNS